MAHAEGAALPRRRGARVRAGRRVLAAGALRCARPSCAQAWWYGATHARGEFWRQPALLPDHRELVRLAGLAARAPGRPGTLRREWRTPRVFVPLAATLLGAAGDRLGRAAAGHQHAWCCSPPLALLGAHGVARLRRGAANMLDWFGVMTFSFFAFLIWLGYFAMQTGLPPQIANNFFKMAPGFVAQFELLRLRCRARADARLAATSRSSPRPRRRAA